MKRFINWILPEKKVEISRESYKISVYQFILDLDSGEFDGNLDLPKIIEKPYSKILESKAMIEMINERKNKLNDKNK